MNITNACSPSDFIGYIFIFAVVAAGLAGGGVAGYISRHKEDKRRFQSSIFLGEMFISVFVGMMIFTLVIWAGWFTFSTGTTLIQLIKSNGLAIVLTAIGGYFAPLIIAIVEKQIYERLGPWIGRKLNLPEVEESEVKK